MGELLTSWWQYLVVRLLFFLYTISPESNSLGKMVGIFVGEWHSYNVVESTADFHFEAFLFRQSCISGKKKRNRRRIFPYRVFTLTVPTHRQIENALTTGFSHCWIVADQPLSLSAGNQPSENIEFEMMKLQFCNLENVSTPSLIIQLKFATVGGGSVMTFEGKHVALLLLLPTAWG